MSVQDTVKVQAEVGRKVQEFIDQGYAVEGDKE